MINLLISFSSEINEELYFIFMTYFYHRSLTPLLKTKFNQCHFNRSHCLPHIFERKLKKIIFARKT